jgi:hypothetical protein
VAPLFEHYGIGLPMPEVGGQTGGNIQDHEQTMLALGLSSSWRSPGQGPGSAPRWPPDEKAGPVTGQTSALRVPAR